VCHVITLEATVELGISAIVNITQSLAITRGGSEAHREVATTDVMYGRLSLIPT
jgi:hypothetical protein